MNLQKMISINTCQGLKKQIYLSLANVFYLPGNASISELVVKRFPLSFKQNVSCQKCQCFGVQELCSADDLFSLTVPCCVQDMFGN